MQGALQLGFFVGCITIKEIHSVVLKSTMVKLSCQSHKEPDVYAPTCSKEKHQNYWTMNFGIYTRAFLGKKGIVLENLIRSNYHPLRFHLQMEYRAFIYTPLWTIIVLKENLLYAI